MKHCEIYHIAYNRVLENVGSLSGRLPYSTMQYYTVHAIPCNIDGVFFFSPTFSNDKYFLNLLAENMFRLVALCTYNHKSYYKQSNWLRTTHFHSKKNESSSLDSQTGVMAQAGKLSLTHQKSCAHPHVSNCATTSIDEWIMTHRFTSIIYHI